MKRFFYGYVVVPLLLFSVCSACSVDSEEMQDGEGKEMGSQNPVEERTKFFTEKDFGVGESYRHDMLIHIVRGYSRCKSREEFAEFLESQLVMSIEDTFYRRIAIRMYVEDKNSGPSAAEMAGQALRFMKWKFDDVEQLLDSLIERAERLKIDRKELYSNKEFKEFLQKAVDYNKSANLK